VAFSAADADQLEIDEPTSYLMGELGALLWAKALYAEAEPLMRRALAFWFTGLGVDHPSTIVATGNYRALLTAMNLSDKEIDARIAEITQ